MRIEDLASAASYVLKSKHLSSFRIVLFINFNESKKLEPQKNDPTETTLEKPACSVRADQRLQTQAYRKNNFEITQPFYKILSYFLSLQLVCI